MPTSPQPAARTAGTAGSGRSVGRSSGGSARGSGSDRSVSVPDAADADADEPDADVIEPVVVAVDDEFAGFVPSVTERVPIRVSLTMPPAIARVSVDAVVEVMISAPGVCGSDMATFGGLPAQVGVVYALNARSGVTAELVEEGAQLLSAFAERGDERRPCALRITVLIAPQGCAFAAAQTDEVGLDDAGRSYAELTWSEDAAAFSLAPTLACEPA